VRVDQVPIEQIRPYAGNPRRNAGAVSKVATSLKTFGWQQPIVVDREMVVIAGHTRLLAARSLGLEQVPVVVAADLTPAQVKAYRLADNRTGEEASWDADLLKAELGDLETQGFDLRTVGFDEDELRRIATGLSRQFGGDPNAAPDVPDVPTSQRGDCWLLGNHRLLCGSAISPEDVDRVLGGAKPKLMVTDPPYGVNLRSGVAGPRRRRRQDIGDRQGA
jgi:ParB-like chromosome segregation protein Spo0J